MTRAFRHRMRVRWSECDLQGVVFYPQYLAYFDHALTELWREAMGSYSAMWEAGADMVVGEAGIRYRASARFDDEVDVVATVTRLGTTSITTALAVERVPDGVVLAEGELRHVFVAPGSLERTQIPQAVRRALAPYAVASEALGG